MRMSCLFAPTQISGISPVMLAMIERHVLLDEDIGIRTAKCREDAIGAKRQDALS